jgi:drug/metabolite transporter (DMT)-like permease
MLCGGAILLAISLVSSEPVNHAPQMVPILAWMYLVVFGSIIAFSAYMTLLSRTSATLAASYSFVNPVIAMMLGIVIADERVTSREWLAAGIIIIGVILLLAGRSRRGSISSPPISIPPESPRV